MSPAALAGFVDSIGAAGAGVRKAELAMSLPLSRELPGNGFQQAETDEQRCGKRQQHRPVSRETRLRSDGLDICGLLLWGLGSH